MGAVDYRNRPPRRPGLPDEARAFWIDEEVARLHGIDVERMRATYADIGIKIITDRALDNGDGHVICPGCEVEYHRSRECWQVSAAFPDGWRPLCRECENTQLYQNLERVRGRRYNAKHLRTNIHKGATPRLRKNKSRRVIKPVELRVEKKRRQNP